MVREKSHFLEHEPFAKVRAYRLWFWMTVGLTIGLLLIILASSFLTYQSCQQLKFERDALAVELKTFDEIVRQKNRLLNSFEKNGKVKDRTDGAHSQILDFLSEIEQSLTGSVYLESAEFTPEQVELVGYSKTLQCLADFVDNVQRLSFGHEHSLEQVTNTKKSSGEKQAFTVLLKLSS